MWGNEQNELARATPARTRSTNLFSAAVRHEPSRAVCSTHVQQHVSRGREGAKVLSLEQAVRPVGQEEDEDAVAAAFSRRSPADRAGSTYRLV